MTSKELVPGLAGVPAARSAVSFIDGQEGILAYRGHRIEVLAEKSTYEETAWLLLHGALPTRAELDGFRARLSELRFVPDELLDMVRALPRSGHPMEALQASLAGLGMVSAKTDLEDAASCGEAVLRVLAAAPVLIAAFERLRSGEEIVAPDPELGHAGNFLWMLNGEKPDHIRERVLDCALILHAVVEVRSFVGGDVVEAADVDAGGREQPAQTEAIAELGADVGQRGSPVRRADGYQRRHAMTDTEVGDRVSCIEPTHAVGDDVDASGGDTLDPACQVARPDGYRCTVRDAHAVDLHAEVAQAFGHASKVLVTLVAEVDLVEADDAVDENDGVAQ